MDQSTINAGNIVVPLSEIIDKLQGKLSTADVNALLLAVVTPRKNEVRPGDLITAELINQMLFDIADLKLKIAQIDTGGHSSSGAVQIQEPNPSRTLRIGDPLVIVGNNLLGTNTKVLLEEAFMTTFERGSTNQMLLIKTIPVIQNIPEKGRVVSLIVSNDNGTDSTTFTLAQPIITKPTGNLFINRFGTLIDPIVAGGSSTFTYHIRVVATIDETYDLNPSVDIGWSAKTIDPETKKEITSILIPKGKIVVDGTTLDVGVIVTVPVGTAAGTIGNLTLKVTSQKNPDLTMTSDKTELAVDKKVSDPLPITLTPSFVTSPGKLDPASVKPRFISVPATGNVDDEVDASFLATIPSNGRYSIQTPLTFTGNTAGWTAKVLGGAAGRAMTVPDESFVITIKASPGASTAKLKIKIVSDTDAKIFGEIEQDVKPS